MVLGAIKMKTINFGYLVHIGGGFVMIVWIENFTVWHQEYTIERRESVRLQYSPVEQVLYEVTDFRHYSYE